MNEKKDSFFVENERGIRKNMRILFGLNGNMFESIGIGKQEFRKQHEDLENFFHQHTSLQKAYEQHQTEIAILEYMNNTKGLLISILEKTTDLVYMADSQDQVFYINPACMKMVGLDIEQVLQSTIYDFHPEWLHDFYKTKVIPTAIHDGMWQGETVFLSRDGREIPTSQVLIAHKEIQNEVAFFSTIIREIIE